jgi:hypothetical protein
MTTKVERRSRGTDWLGLLSFGFFLLLLDTVWIMNPNALADEAKAFVKSESWHLKPLTGNLTPRAHRTLLWLPLKTFMTDRSAAF